MANNSYWHIAFYIRLSKDDGNDESLSVTNQRKILQEYIKLFFQDKYILIDEYIDDGKSGTDYDRPSFQRMIEDIKANKVNCIICKNLARAFRNYSDQGYFIEYFFPLHNTRFITLSDPKVDTYLNPEAINGMEVPISGLMNDRFAAQTSSSIRRTFDNKRRNGEFIGAFAPYGYMKAPYNKNALIIDKTSAGVVKDIFNWYVIDNMSKEGIVRKLNELGIPNPTAYKKYNGLKYCNPHAINNDGLWTARSVTMILKNKVYIGTMVQGRQKVISYKVHDKIAVPENEWYEVANTHEPIIKQELFNIAQELQLMERRTAPGKKMNYLFSGLLKCADCKKTMTRNKVKSGHIYYTCSTYKRKSKSKCTKHTIRLDKLEAAILAAVKNQIDLIEDIENIITQINNESIAKDKYKYLENLLNIRKKELDKKNNLTKNLYIDWKNGDLTKEEYVKMKLEFEEEIVQLTQTINHMETEIESINYNITTDNPYLKHFIKYKNIKNLSQGLILELIDNIYIHENSQISIHFKFNDPFKAL